MKCQRLDLGDRALDLNATLHCGQVFDSKTGKIKNELTIIVEGQKITFDVKLDFYGGTNITLGLPIVRTSPDHGTAFDIAGQGIANKKSMVEAIRAADLIIKARLNAN